MHFALRRTNILFEEVTDRLAELTAGSVLLSVSPLDDPDRSSPWNRVPIDFSQARRPLEAALRLVYEHVNARRAALYLCGWNQQSLVCVASQGVGPDEVDGDVGLGKSGSGLARRAFVTGRPHVIDDGWTRGSAVGTSAADWRRRSIRSAAALPITLFDRVVGVLLLTSPQISAFVETLRFVEALAQHMSLALMFAQRAEEQRGFVIASSTAVHAHEILKRVDRLRATGARTWCASPRRSSSSSTGVSGPRTGPRTSTLVPYEILDQAAADVGVDEWVVWEGSRLDVPPLSPAVAMALRHAAQEVLKNSKSHLRFDTTTRVSLRARLHRRGGLPRLLVDITQVVDRPVPDDVVRKIYRTPIEDYPTASGRGRRHFGAFIAGYWMRAVGGDVLLKENSESNGSFYVGTTLEIPIYTLAPMPGQGTGRARQESR